MKEYVVAVDVARKHDYYNIMAGKVVAQIVPGADVLGIGERVVHFLDIIHIEKYQKMDYEEAAGRVARLVGHRDLVGNVELIVDATGIGDAAIETIRKATPGTTPVPIVFTSGGSVREVRGTGRSVFALTPADSRVQTLAVLEEIHVPKADLVAAGKLLLEQRRVRVADGLRWREDFKKQLEGFRGKVNEQTRHVSYEAMTDSVHDDQVVCYLMLAWWLQRMTRQIKAKQGPLVKAEEMLVSDEPYARRKEE